jgi:ribosomal protein L35
MKTNKSYTKRLKVTRTGKIIARKAGQNHFNAKENRRSQQDKRRSTPLVMKNKARSRFLAQSF